MCAGIHTYLPLCRQGDDVWPTLQEPAMPATPWVGTMRCWYRGAGTMMLTAGHAAI